MIAVKETWINNLRQLIQAPSAVKVQELIVFQSPPLLGKSNKSAEGIRDDVMKKFARICASVSRAFGPWSSRQETIVELDPAHDWQMYSWLKAARVVDWKVPGGIKVFAAIRHVTKKAPFEIVVGGRFLRTIPKSKRKTSGSEIIARVQELMKSSKSKTVNLRVSKDFYDDIEDDLYEKTEEFTVEWESIVADLSAKLGQPMFKGRSGIMIKLAKWKTASGIVFVGLEHEDKELPLILQLGLSK